MRARLGRHTTTILVAMVTAAITAGGPLLAAQVYDAENAHQVDGRHAVGAASTAAERAGKLVATDGSGRLPNSIIERAPDSARVGGRTASGLTRMGSVSSNVSTELTDTPTRFGSTLVITAPTDGYVLVSYAVTALEDGGCSFACTVQAKVRHVESGEESVEMMDSAMDQWANVAGTAVFEVRAGVNRFRTVVSRETVQGGAIYGYKQNISGVFSPFDESGQVPPPPTG